jgi:cytochrome c55X
MYPLVHSRKRKWHLPGIALATLLLLCSTSLGSIKVGSAATNWVSEKGVPNEARQSELMHLLKHDCGSCHGMTRKGGLGPSLLPEALRGRPPAFLVQTILDGRPGTPMPPWRGLLEESEVRWLTEVLRKGSGL